MTSEKIFCNIPNELELLAMLLLRGMMEHPIYSVRGLDCKLTNYPLFERYKMLSSSLIYFWPGNT